MRLTVYAIIYDNNKYLITRRIKAGSDYWQFVGGGIEEGESPETALKREISEEISRTDFEIIKKLPFTSEGHKFQNDRYWKKVHFFLVRMDSSKPINLDEDHAEYKWGTKQEILDTLQYEIQKKDFLKALEFM